MRKSFLSVLFGISLFTSSLGWASFDPDDVDDYVVGTSALTITNALTISLLLKADTSNDITYFGEAWDDGATWDEAYIRFSFEKANGAGVTTGILFYAVGGLYKSCASNTGYIVNNEWHIYTVTRSGGTVTFYRDGSQFQQRTDCNSSNIDAGNGIPYTIAQRSVGSPGQFSNGLIDEVAFWNSALSATEVYSLGAGKVKRMPLNISPSTLQLYLAMDEGSDGTSADGDTFYDLSGKANHGTGVDGANNTGLTWVAESVLTYP